MSVEMLKLAFANKTKMTASERLVLLSLAYHHNSANNACCPSQATIANDTRLSRRGVQIALHGLCRKSIIERSSGRKLTRFGSLYRLIGLEANVIHPTGEDERRSRRTPFAESGEQHSHHKELRTKHRHYGIVSSKPEGLFIKGGSQNVDDYRL